MEYKEIVIEWGTKYELDITPKKYSSLDELDLKMLNSVNVFYQLYGDSHVYGRELPTAPK